MFFTQRRIQRHFFDNFAYKIAFKNFACKIAFKNFSDAASLMNLLLHAE